MIHGSQDPGGWFWVGLLGLLLARIAIDCVTRPIDSAKQFYQLFTDKK